MWIILGLVAALNTNEKWEWDCDGTVGQTTAAG